MKLPKNITDRQMVKETVASYFFERSGTPLPSISEIIAKHGTDVALDIDVETTYDDPPYISLLIIRLREENDREYDGRIAAKRERQKSLTAQKKREEKDRAEYARLHALYGGK